MKLYFHPASTTSRAVMHFASDAGIALEYQLIDLLTGEQLQPPYRALNPNCLVPMLEDGSFRLTESSAILKYLADSIDSPAYPKALRERARVHEAIDWVNSNLYRDLLLQYDYATYPNVRRWLSNVKALPSWEKVNEALDGWTASVKTNAFIVL